MLPGTLHHAPEVQAGFTQVTSRITPMHIVSLLNPSSSTTSVSIDSNFGGHSMITGAGLDLPLDLTVIGDFEMDGVIHGSNSEGEGLIMDSDVGGEKNAREESDVDGKNEFSSHEATVKDKGKRQGETLASKAEKKQKVSSNKTTKRRHSAKDELHTGSFVIDPVRMRRFEDNICIPSPTGTPPIDAGAEFDIQSSFFGVRHSLCGETLSMRQPYNSENFKKHVKICKGASKTKDGKPNNLNGAGMSSKSLVNFFLPAPPKRVPPTLQQMACPGVTALNDERVEDYLLRTMSLGGGASRRVEVSKTMFQKTYKDLLAKQKAEVKKLQETQWRWVNHYKTRHITSFQCIRLIKIEPGTSPKMCLPCQSLLKLKAFKNALAHPTPTAENVIHTPKEYRSDEVAKSNARITGVSELLNAPVCRFVSFTRGICSPRKTRAEHHVFVMQRVFFRESFLVELSLLGWLKLLCNDRTRKNGVLGTKTQSMALRTMSLCTLCKSRVLPLTSFFLLNFLFKHLGIYSTY